jgi:hypothetical protein
VSLAVLVAVAALVVFVPLLIGHKSSPAPSAAPYVLVRDTAGRPLVVSGNSSNPRLKLNGVTVWLLPNNMDEEHRVQAEQQWTRRHEIIKQVASWGANLIRLRVDALQYNQMGPDGQKDYLARLAEVCKLATDTGLYVNVSFWDVGAMHGSWPDRYQELFPLIKASLQAIGNNPRVFYNPIGEPNQLARDGQLDSDVWVTPTEKTIQEYRNLGYKGLLVIGTWNYSYGYRNTRMAMIEQFDASQPGMNGRPQVGFDQHDYAITVTYKPSHQWSFDAWLARIGGSNQTHLIFEFEVGNQGVGPNALYPEWSKGAATDFGVHGQAFNFPWFGGGAAFVYYWPFQLPGGNSILDPQGNFTTWGKVVYHDYLGNP